MTLATTRPERERQNYNFLAVFNNAKKSSTEVEVAPEIIQENTVENRLASILAHSQTLSIVSFKVIPAGKLFVSNKYLITVKLTEQFATNFVVLRGLLEFSRPKNITMSSRTKDQTFEIELLETHADHFLTYIQTILGWLINEIKFKQALKAIIKFENRVKQEQAILYSNMRSSYG
jgi:hypothetical protein